jgi:excisionase family DNA binding protein
MSAHNRPEKPAASERLLTTREAATFLKVSEASIRRWTDSGLLPTSRVGRRGARRLRDEDLRRFLEAGRTQPVAATQTSLVATIVIQDVVVPLGSHLASFYTTPAGRLRLGLPFLRDGLLAGQTVVLRALPEVREHFFGVLREERIDVAEAIRLGLLVVFPEGPGSAAEQVAKFERALSESSRKRPGPIRVLAEILADVQSVGSVAEHLLVEHQLGALCKRFPVVMLCPYDVRSLDGSTVLEALKLHADIFGPQVGYWLN